MKNSTTRKRTNPIDKKEEVPQSNDKHIAQDFENYPKSPGSEHLINPKTKADKLTADGGRNTRKQNPPKKKAAKQGDTTGVEKALANTLGGKNNTSGEPNKVERIKKQKVERG